MEFPEWINQDVKDLVVILNDQIEQVTDNPDWIEERAATENKTQILESVVHSDNCKDTWVNSRKLSKEHGQLWLAVSILDSVPNPKDGPQRKKKSEITSWSDKVVKTCEELNELLNECPNEKIDVQHSISDEIKNYILTRSTPGRRAGSMDTINFIRKHLEDNKEITINNKYFIENLILDIRNILRVDIMLACYPFDTNKAINTIISEVNRNKLNNTFWPVQVKNAHSDRGYFVRALTNAYVKISQTSHRRDVTNITNATRFDDISEPKLSYINGKGATGGDIDVVKENYLLGETAKGLDEYKIFIPIISLPSVYFLKR